MVLGCRSFCRNLTSLMMSCHFCTQTQAPVTAQTQSYLTKAPSHFWPQTTSHQTCLWLWPILNLSITVRSLYVAGLQMFQFHDVAAKQFNSWRHCLQLTVSCLSTRSVLKRRSIPRGYRGKHVTEFRPDWSPRLSASRCRTSSWLPPPHCCAHLWPAGLSHTKKQGSEVKPIFWWNDSLASSWINAQRSQLTKYTAPKLPWPISRRSAKSFSGSSLQKRSARSGSFRLPARALEGMARAWQTERMTGWRSWKSRVHLYSSTNSWVWVCVSHRFF